MNWKQSKNSESETSMKGGRTDLALEVRESFTEDNVEIKGVILKKEENEQKDIRVTTVEITDKQGEKVMGKPIGTYITIEAPHLNEKDENFYKPLSEEIAKYVERLAGGLKNKQVLVVGLGNREVTPDALGPDVVDNLFVTRHLINEYGKEFKEKHNMESMSAISPGVMAQTGMETGEIIAGVIHETKPDLVIVIDALAARSVERLNRTVQITDTGISPGAGVGNNRKELNRKNLGVDVIALGVPTVVDAATIVSEHLERLLSRQGFSEKEVECFIQEMNDPSMRNMFVTPKNIDESIKQISYTISEALNQCFFKGIGA
ncbi:GPR endopeptidase [Anaeromicropila populeti]|uniref:Germination protease n=1 Tax=Anaeromicropila populeti TaxID=37658 RepID=A0A1I6IPU1_9FIRM|nr:GPR endopeptidase [Anaeromicropila populeti]SFR68738.1 spore protease [Anaeromicropila populeti]